MGWFGDPYSYSYWFLGYRWSPWLPWWISPYRPVMPYMMIPKEQEITMLEYQRKLMEEALEKINKRLEELKKEEVTH